MNEHQATTVSELSPEKAGVAELSALAARGTLGGILMGLANLVPGISGGTMLLAAGVYPRFVRAVAEVSTLRFRPASLVVLGSVVAAAGLGILLLAGTIKDLVVHHRWIMYSVFIGLTLGGIPVVWRMARPASRGVWLGAGAGFVAMAILALLQQAGSGTQAGGGNSTLMFGLAGVAGASAMILPGVSGGYLLLILGQYIPILSAIDALKVALEAGELAKALVPGVQVLLPVGIGVVIGVVGVSNLLRWLLARFEKPTLGVLLGLLVGAVVGLWPFQRTVDPVLGETVIKGRVVTAQNVSEFDPEDYPTEHFLPALGQIGGAGGLVLLGATVTLLIAKFGNEESPSR